MHKPTERDEASGSFAAPAGSVSEQDAEVCKRFNSPPLHLSDKQVNILHREQDIFCPFISFYFKEPKTPLQTSKPDDRFNNVKEDKICHK